MGGARLNPQDILRDYVDNKQTYAQLAEKYNCSARTIRRHLYKALPVHRTEFAPEAVVVMDTTYFGRDMGVMVFKNANDGNVLLLKFVRHETVGEYVNGIAEITTRGIRVRAIVCDGRKGVVQAFPDIPVQTCQFHQVKTVTKYLTKKPKTAAAIELKSVASALVHCTSGEFTALLDRWYARWHGVLNERSVDGVTGRTQYTHKRLRSAYFSMRKNIPQLFEFERHPEIAIPNTTNCLDGQFSDLKNKLRNHNGLSAEHRKKIIQAYFGGKPGC